MKRNFILYKAVFWKRGRLSIFCMIGAAIGAAACTSLFSHGVEERRIQEEISQQVLRFHIRGDSDREEAQQLKGKVKKDVVAYLQSVLEGCGSKEECMGRIRANLFQVEQVARETCGREGEAVEVRAYLSRESFPLKQYGDLILPSGVYDALRVDLGKGEGKNWWCMMYPSLCLVDGITVDVPRESKRKLSEHLSQEAYDSLFAEQGDGPEASLAGKEKKVKYRIKWKLYEFLFPQ